MAKAARDWVDAHEHASCTMVDLQDHPLPVCDGDAAYGDAAVAALRGQIEQADGILVATPIYNYDVSASTKNLLELTGSAWTGKVVGFLCAAGGKSSYMSVMAFANSLMLDFRCTIIPRFVYAEGDAFGGDSLTDPSVTQRIGEICQRLIHVADALAHLPDPPAAVEEVN